MKKIFLLLAFVIYIVARTSIKSERFLLTNTYGKMIQLNQNGIFQNNFDNIKTENSKNDDNYSKKNSIKKLSENENEHEKKSKLRNKESDLKEKKEDKGLFDFLSQGIFICVLINSKFF